MEAALLEDLDKFLERLAAEVSELQHLRLFAANEVTDILDVGGLQAVVGTHGEIQLVDRLREELTDALHLGIDLLLLLRRLGLALHRNEEIDVVAKYRSEERRVGKERGAGVGRDGMRT